MSNELSVSAGSMRSSVSKKTWMPSCEARPKLASAAFAATGAIRMAATTAQPAASRGPGIGVGPPYPRAPQPASAGSRGLPRLRKGVRRPGALGLEDERQLALGLEAAVGGTEGGAGLVERE